MFIILKNLSSILFGIYMLNVQVSLEKTITPPSPKATMGAVYQDLEKDSIYAITLCCTGTYSTVSSNFSISGCQILSRTGNTISVYDDNKAHAEGFIIKTTSNRITVTRGYGHSYADLAISSIKID